MESLLTRHRKESKDLLARIASKKKGATKKTRKGIDDECASLESELKRRHSLEIATLEGESINVDEDSRTEESLTGSIIAPISFDSHTTTKASELSSTSELGQESMNGSLQNPPSRLRRRNRQQERLARRAAHQEVVALQAAEEAMELPDLRQAERKRLLEEFHDRGLEEKSIAANGHCLYSAVADQLLQLGIELDPSIESMKTRSESPPALSPDDYRKVRGATAEYIVQNPETFLPFLEEPLQDYIGKIKDSSEWGGQLELLAISRAYGINVNIVQAEGRVEKIQCGNHSGNNEAWLAYYRHGFGLGEHYNSLHRTPAKESR